ncbi:trypsin-like peptidase domain-containing protein [Actinomadura sp. NAK00032]|uniref:trypsin-like peptidase domain-containing protein n=1 Tax=Actinomadura sp. NAK00032 TaxID=2742128 RepID=UPI0015920C02|nr:serine protease [Actinomadura sp. NAK00032]QKW32650.1 trypsin-like peptidase domain-containing protein [Actinomadura sp. NAK00032]
MQRRILGVLVAALLGTGTLSAAASAASAAPQAPAPARAAVDFTGIVALSNCSGSLVRTPNSADTDPALVLTNGHCYEGGMPSAGQVITNRSSSRTFTLLNSSGQGSLGTLRASAMLYATMTDTDVALYRLNRSYASIRQTYGTPALEMSLQHPTAGTDLRVVSGYWRRMYSCNLDGFAYRLREGQWTWKDSVRYTSECDVIGGTSGSPVIDAASDDVIAVNNTINEDGGRCTLNNPCEVDESGNVTVRPNIGYAQQTYILAACIAPGSVIDYNRPGCLVPRG